MISKQTRPPRPRVALPVDVRVALRVVALRHRRIKEGLYAPAELERSGGTPLILCKFSLRSIAHTSQRTHTKKISAYAATGHNDARLFRFSIFLFFSEIKIRKKKPFFF